MNEDEILELHRGVLANPDCPDCNRRAVARYRCLICGEIVESPGEFRWSWQGRGHWHEPDDHAALVVAFNDHRVRHDGTAAFIPVKENR